MDGARSVAAVSSGQKRNSATRKRQFAGKFCERRRLVGSDVGAPYGLFGQFPFQISVTHILKMNSLSRAAKLALVRMLFDAGGRNEGLFKLSREWDYLYAAVGSRVEALLRYAY